MLLQTLKFFQACPRHSLKYAMDNTQSNLWLSVGHIHPVSPWQAGFAVQPHWIYCLIVVEKKLSVVTDHIWVWNKWNNQDDLEGKKKLKWLQLQVN